MSPVYHPGAYKDRKWTCCRVTISMGKSLIVSHHQHSMLLLVSVAIVDYLRVCMYNVCTLFLNLVYYTIGHGIDLCKLGWLDLPTTQLL